MQLRAPKCGPHGPACHRRVYMVSLINTVRDTEAETDSRYLIRMDRSRLKPLKKSGSRLGSDNLDLIRKRRRFTVRRWSGTGSRRPPISGGEDFKALSRKLVSRRALSSLVEWNDGNLTPPVPTMVRPFDFRCIAVTTSRTIFADVGQSPDVTLNYDGIHPGIQWRRPPTLLKCSHSSSAIVNCSLIAVRDAALPP